MPASADEGSVGGWTLIGLAMVVAGALLAAPGLLLIGGLTLLSRWLTTLWSRYGLESIGYERRLATRRAVWGDRVLLDVEVWNRKLLPVPLLTADDHVTDTLRITGRALVASERPGQGVLQNSWSLLWYERVIRHLVIDARRRGAFTFGPLRLTVSDLFERGTNSEDRELPDELLVRPRTVPVRAPHAARAPLGTTRTRNSLFTDPSRFAGVRRYEPGDPIRRIHWRATARVGEPVSRRHEPVNERQVLIAVDLQTVPGPYWLMLFDDDQVEALCVAAASLARRMLRTDTACGLLVGAQLAGGRRWTYLPPTAAASQLGRIEDVLARVQPILSLPFERLLGVIPRRLAPGGTILSLGARDPEPYADRLRRLSRTGYAVTHLAFGPDRGTHRAGMVRAGIGSHVAQLDPGWKEADALVLAG
ncbi:MAG: DUF58 domain-containing protein [Chloroflexota bacterium]|nr:DUF58 domain-containing protein [Chloroflexota bacterium]